jgi:hypothetical protein
VNLQLNITGFGVCFLSTEEFADIYFDWVNFKPLGNSALMLGTSKVWDACIFQIVFSILGSPN